MTQTTLSQGHCLDILPTMEAASVQTVCTSPPFFGLRSYGHYEMQVCWGDRQHFHTPRRHPERHWLRLRWRAAERGGVWCPQGCCWIGALGLEPRIADYIAHLVQIFRAVRRVMRPDGVLFVNIGDSYSRNPLKGERGPHGKQATMPDPGAVQKLSRACTPLALPEKSLCLIPQRLAIALSDDGWIVRQVFPWIKRNSMPESVQDRPTSALEWWLMCVKQPRYFSDMTAVQQPSTVTRESKAGHSHGTLNRQYPGNPQFRNGARDRQGPERTYRNTDLWFASLTAPHGLVGMGDELVGLDVPTQAGPGGHYATFSADLVEPLLRMSTSLHGACGQCGSPWRRVTARTAQRTTTRGEQGWTNGTRRHAHVGDPQRDSRGSYPEVQVQTTGWAATCSCDAPPSHRCVVLDPFAGRGSTLLAAQRLGLDGIGIELSVTDVEKTRQRLEAEAPLLAHIQEGKA